jgi:hypothetical protein
VESPQQQQQAAAAFVGTVPNEHAGQEVRALGCRGRLVCGARSGMEVGTRHFMGCIVYANVWSLSCFTKWFNVGGAVGVISVLNAAIYMRCDDAIVYDIP